MNKHFIVKRKYLKVIPNLRPEIEIDDTVELRTREIHIETDWWDENEESHTYYYDKNGVLFPKAYLDIYYEEII